MACAVGLLRNRRGSRALAPQVPKVGLNAIEGPARFANRIRFASVFVQHHVGIVVPDFDVLYVPSRGVRRAMVTVGRRQSAHHRMGAGSARSVERLMDLVVELEKDLAGRVTE